jgi:hypothetical protein
MSYRTRTGWFKESFRHSLAARGVVTKSNVYLRRRRLSKEELQMRRQEGRSGGPSTTSPMYGNKKMIVGGVEVVFTPQERKFFELQKERTGKNTAYEEAVQAKIALSREKDKVKRQELKLKLAAATGKGVFVDGKFVGGGKKIAPIGSTTPSKELLAGVSRSNAVILDRNGRVVVLKQDDVLRKQLVNAYKQYDSQVLESYENGVPRYRPATLSEKRKEVRDLLRSGGVVPAAVREVEESIVRRADRKNVGQRALRQSDLQPTPGKELIAEGALEVKTKLMRQQRGGVIASEQAVRDKLKQIRSIQKDVSAQRNSEIARVRTNQSMSEAEKNYAERILIKKYARLEKDLTGALKTEVSAKKVRPGVPRVPASVDETGKSKAFSLDPAVVAKRASVEALLRKRARDAEGTKDALANAELIKALASGKRTLVEKTPESELNEVRQRISRPIRESPKDKDVMPGFTPLREQFVGGSGKSYVPPKSTYKPVSMKARREAAATAKPYPVALGLGSASIPGGEPRFPKKGSLVRQTAPSSLLPKKPAGAQLKDFVTQTTARKMRAPKSVPASPLAPSLDSAASDAKPE